MNQLIIETLTPPKVPLLRTRPMLLTLIWYASCRDSSLGDERLAVRLEAILAEVLLDQLRYELTWPNESRRQ